MQELPWENKQTTTSAFNLSNIVWGNSGGGWVITQCMFYMLQTAAFPHRSFETESLYFQGIYVLTYVTGLSEYLPGTDVAINLAMKVCGASLFLN